MNRMTVTWFLVALAGCDSWSPEMTSEVPPGPVDEMEDETIEVRSAEEADALGLDVEEWRRLQVQPSIAAVTVTCGGLLYTKQTYNGCSGSGSSAVCRTANTHTECNQQGGSNSDSPCQYYIGACLNGQYANRLHHDKDLHWPVGTPGNPSSGQAYWSLVTGTTTGDSQPIYYRERPSFLQLINATAPAAYSSLLVDHDCGNYNYLRAVNPAPGLWVSGRYNYIVPQILNGKPIQVFRGTTSTGTACPASHQRADRVTSPYDRFRPNFVGGLGDAFIIDGGPLSSSALSVWVRPVSAQEGEPDPGDDDGTDDGGPTCTPFPQSCTLTSQCCAGLACLDTIGEGKQCCECFWLGNGQYCGIGSQCNNAQAEGKDVIWPGDPRWPAPGE
jgi:hypothetical protein